MSIILNAGIIKLMAYFCRRGGIFFGMHVVLPASPSSVSWHFIALSL